MKSTLRYWVDTHALGQQSRSFWDGPDKIIDRITKAVIEKDLLLDRWPLMQKELEYRYQRLMGGIILT